MWAQNAIERLLGRSTSTFEDLADLRDTLVQIETLDHDRKRRAAWRGFEMSKPLKDRLAAQFAALDPFSADYRAAVLDVFAELRQSDYTLSDEGSGAAAIDVKTYVANPIPFSLGDTALIGEFLISYGHVLRVIGQAMQHLDRPAKVLELGCGQGALTSFLARANLHVTSMDVSPEMTELTRAVTAQARPPVNVVTSSFEAFEVEEPQDVILFFESFHHCLNHVEVLQKYREALTDQGIMIFAAEPIVAQGSGTVPYPWGLRLDTISMRQIVINGWLELGFQRPYFTKMLTDNGLSAEDCNLQGLARAQAIVARKR